MNKIICDVCGTSYPDTSSQCPICGYVKPSKAKAAPKEDGGYVHVKGGRFSASNVQKRNMDKGITPVDQPTADQKSTKGAGNMVLGITAIVLLLVLIVVMAFFIVKIVEEFKNNAQPAVTTSPVITTQSAPTTQDPDVQIPCQSVSADTTEISLAQIGDTYLPVINLSPEDTTDQVKFSSADESVATVDDNGLITTVAEGSTVVTVTCGKAKLEIEITCATAETTTDPTETTTGEVEESLINRTDITLTQKGETWDLYSKSTTVPKNKIKWTSEDETIVTVDGGVVTAVGNGITKITAEHEDKSYTCTVRCNLPDADADTESDIQTSEGNSSARVSKEEVTLLLNSEADRKSFYLYLLDKDDNKLDVTWEASEDGFVAIDGNKITAIKLNKKLIISTTYEGNVHKCIIHIYD